MKKQNKNNHIFKLLWTLSKQEDNKIYLVGGFLRDILLNKHNTDIDIVVEQDTRSFAEKFAGSIKGTFVPLDEKNGIFRVVKKVKKEIYTVDFSRMRRNDIAEDLLLRDFTVNAMALPLTHQFFKNYKKRVIDPLNGMIDIKRKIIRGVSDRIFTDDPLRLIRAFRMAANLEFSIARDTERQIEKKVHLIRKVSPERIRYELFSILDSTRSYNWVLRMDKNGLLLQIFPEIKSMKDAKDFYFHPGGLWEHSTETLKAVEEIIRKLTSTFPKTHRMIANHLNETVQHGVKRIALLKLCALFHDIGKPASVAVLHGRVRFFGHEDRGAVLVKTIAKRLRMGGKEIKVLEKLTGYHMRPANIMKVTRLTDRAINKYFRDLGREAIDTMILSLADQYSYIPCKLIPGVNVEKGKKVIEKMLKRYYYKKEKVLPSRILRGDEIIRLFDLKPGPIIGTLLRKIEEAQCDGKIKEKADAVELVRKALKNYENIDYNPRIQ